MARIIQGTRTGQILIGDFRTKVMQLDEDDAPKIVGVDTAGFMRGYQDSLANLQGVRLSGDEIASIRG